MERQTKGNVAALVQNSVRGKSKISGQTAQVLTAQRKNITPYFVGHPH